MIKEVKLGSICNIYSAGDKPKNFSEAETSDLNVPVYGNGRDNEGLVGFTDKAGVLSEAVTVAARGSSCGVAFYRTKPYMPIVRLISLVAKEGIDTKYLYYQVCNRHFKGSGSGQPQITIPDIADAPIHLETELELQEKYSEVLFTLDEKIANNNAICSNLEAMAKLLYDYWFVQFDFPDENGKPYKSSGGKMVWNDELKREIPAGWEVNTLAHYCLFENGDRSSNYPSGTDFIPYGIPFVAGGAIKETEIDYSEVRYISEEKYASLRAGKANKGDILMTLRGSLAKCVYSPYDKMAIASALVIVRPNNGVSREYLHRVLISDYYVQLLNNYDNGSVQANLSVDTIKSFPMVFPKLDIIKLFTSIISKIEDKEASLREENQQLVSLRNFLLPMLMNGQVKVGA